MPTNEIRFVVPGNPVPKARPRVGKNGHMYTPKETTAYEAKVKAAALQARVIASQEPGAELWDMRAMRYHLFVLAYKSTSRSMDADNVFKSVADALRGTLYADDDHVGGSFGPVLVDANPRLEVVIRSYEREYGVVDADEDRRFRLRNAARALVLSRMWTPDEGTAIDELCDVIDRRW